MDRLNYLRAVVVEGEAFLDQAIEEIADVKAWLLIHRAKTELGPHHLFLEQVEVQHKRASRALEIMRLVHKRCTFTSQEALKELKRRKGVAQDVMDIASHLMRTARRSSRISEAIQALFGEDFVGLTQHVVKLAYGHEMRLTYLGPGPAEEPVAIAPPTAPKE